MTHVSYLWLCYGAAIFLLGTNYIAACLEWRKTRRHFRNRLQHP
jgi:uncharacterized BrkB/YihY/UPF0761 family membrane protein